MKIIEQSAKVLATSMPTNDFYDELNDKGIMQPDTHHIVEYAMRNCYQSQNLMKEGSDKNLIVKNAIEHKHESVLEHAYITFELVVDRQLMGQITRHRMASYSIESQRYCNYSKDKYNNEISFIKPFDLKEEHLEDWVSAMEQVEYHYFNMLKVGYAPEVARTHLPNSVATKIVMTLNLRSLRNFLQLRLSPHAQSDIKNIAKLMHEAVSDYVPSYFFEDIVN